MLFLITSVIAYSLNIMWIIPVMLFIFVLSLLVKPEIEIDYVVAQFGAIVIGLSGYPISGIIMFIVVGYLYSMMINVGMVK